MMTLCWGFNTSEESILKKKKKKEGKKMSKRNVLIN